jgi:hypothetical protein
MDAWVLLGETRYHALGFLAPTPDEIRTPFNRILAVDSTSPTPYTHILEVDAFSGDSAAYSRDLDRLARVPGADTTVRLYRQMRDALWGSDAAAADALRSLVDRQSYLLATVAEGALVGGTAERVATTIAAMPVTATTAAGYRALTFVLAGLGRGDDARIAGRKAFTADPANQDALAVGWRGWFLGTADSAQSLAALGDGRRLLAGHGYGYLADEEYGIATRDSALVVRAMSAATARDSTIMPRFYIPVYLAVHGWLAIAAGDTARGLREIDSLFARTRFTITQSLAMPRFVRAAAMARQPKTRAEGIRLLRYAFEYEPWLFHARQRVLREVLADSIRADAGTH